MAVIHLKFMNRGTYCGSHGSEQTTDPSQATCKSCLKLQSGTHGMQKKGTKTFKSNKRSIWGR